MAFLGVSSVSELNEKIDKGIIALNKKSEEAFFELESHAEEIRDRADLLESNYNSQEDALAKLQAKLPVLERTTDDVASLQKRVDSIEIFGSKAKPIIGEESATVTSIMDGYQRYLNKLGVEVDRHPAIYELDDDGGGGFQFTFYDPVERRIALGTQWDSYSLLVMYGHYALHLQRKSHPTTSGDDLLLGAVSDYLAWSYLSDTDPDVLKKWRREGTGRSNLQQLLSELKPYKQGVEFFECRDLIRRALVDAATGVGKPALAKAAILAFYSVTVRFTDEPAILIGDFATRLYESQEGGIFIQRAFAHVGLEVPRSTDNPVPTKN